MIQFMKKILAMLRFRPHPRQVGLLESIKPGSISCHVEEQCVTIGISPELQQAINNAKNLLQEFHRMLMRDELKVKTLPISHHRLTFYVKENLMKQIDKVNSDLVSMLEDPE